MTRSLGLWLHPLLLTEGTWCSRVWGLAPHTAPCTALVPPKLGPSMSAEGGHTALEEGRQVSISWRASVQDALPPTPQGSTPRLPSRARRRPVC